MPHSPTLQDNVSLFSLFFLHYSLACISILIVGDPDNRANAGTLHERIQAGAEVLPGRELLDLQVQDWQESEGYSGLPQQVRDDRMTISDIFRYNSIIIDTEHIECYGEPLIHLDVKALCGVNADTGMICLIIFLAFMLVLVIVQFFWDFYKLKTTGQLPWISK